MRSPAQTEAGAQTLAAIALFCYVASLAALCASGHLLFTLALRVAAQQIGAIYSPRVP